MQKNDIKCEGASKYILKQKEQSYFWHKKVTKQRYFVNGNLFTYTKKAFSNINVSYKSFKPPRSKRKNSPIKRENVQWIVNL